MLIDTPVVGCVEWKSLNKWHCFKPELVQKAQFKKGYTCLYTIFLLQDLTMNQTTLFLTLQVLFGPVLSFIQQPEVSQTLFLILWNPT